MVALLSEMNHLWIKGINDDIKNYKNNDVSSSWKQYRLTAPQISTSSCVWLIFQTQRQYQQIDIVNKLLWQTQQYENTGLFWLHFEALLIERIQNAFDRLSGLQRIAWFSRRRRRVARLKTFRGLAASGAALRGKGNKQLSSSIISVYIFGGCWHVIGLQWCGCWIVDFWGLLRFMLRSVAHC